MSEQFDLSDGALWGEGDLRDDADNRSDDIWDDVDDAVAQLETKGYVRVPARKSDDDDGADWDGDSWGWSRQRETKKKDPAPPHDNQGNVLTIEDCEEGLAQVYESMLNIDTEVKGIKNAEHQANRARKLMKKYKEKERRLKDWLDDARAWKRFEEEQKGIKDFGMPREEDNRALTELIAEEAKKFHNTLDDMKDAVADRVRARLDELGDDANDAAVRDKIYNELVQREIIESWEPLEF